MRIFLARPHHSQVTKHLFFVAFIKRTSLFVCRLFWERFFCVSQNEILNYWRLIDKLLYLEKALIAFLYHLQDWSPQFLVYGDMGRIGGAPSLPRLISEAKSGHNTAVLHVGDFAYDLNTQGGLVSKATIISTDHESNTERNETIWCETTVKYSSFSRVHPCNFSLRTLVFDAECNIFVMRYTGSDYLTAIS